jgi:hypothetical protein
MPPRAITSAGLEMHPEHQKLMRKVHIATLHLLPEDGYGRCLSNFAGEHINHKGATPYKERDALLGLRGVALVRYGLSRIETKVGNQVISDEVL